MKIIYIHQHFMTNKGSGGTRSYDVSKYMVRAGHQVSIITGIYDISGLSPLAWYKFFHKELIDGIEVIVCNVPYSNKFGAIKRYWAFLWFVVLATVAAVRVKKPDIVFATSTPLTVGIPGYIAAKLKKVPFVFEVRDIWPESFVQSGWATDKKFSVKMMAKLEAFLYRKAGKILLVSGGFEKSLLKKGVPPQKLKTVPLGADGNLFNNVRPDYGFLDKYSLRGKTVAVFIGAHGKANGLDYVVNAAEFSKNRSDIAYVLIGQGSEKEGLKNLAQSKGLKNIIFSDPIPKGELQSLLAVCNIGLMILKHNQGGYRPVLPNKIFDYMFVGIPSIVNFTGPTLDMLNANDSGIFADGTNPKELADRIAFLADNKERAAQMGENAKKAAWEKYDRKIISEKLIKTFEDVLLVSKK